MSFFDEDPFLTPGLFSVRPGALFHMMDDDDFYHFAGLDAVNRRRHHHRRQQQQVANNAAAAAAASSSSDAVAHPNQQQQQRQQQVATTGGNEHLWTPRRQPRFEVVSNDNEVILRGETPGLPKENLKISVEGGRLTISGQESQEVNDEHQHFHMRKFGSFEQSWQLPGDLDGDGLTAKYDHGVLMVKIPKKAVQQPAARQITIS